jgi:secreted PhoX family phosphatase
MDKHIVDATAWTPEQHGDERPSNTSANRYFGDLAAAQPGRRDVLRGGIAAAMTAMFGGAMIAGGAREARANSLIGFQAVPVSSVDTFVVPPGYKAQPFIPWGTPLLDGAPAWSTGNTGADQAKQIGSHHDGMHYFPIEGRSPYEGSSEDGLLVLNHEYVESRLMHSGLAKTEIGADQAPAGARKADEVLKEINAHGVSIARIRKQASGDWAVVPDPRNRRVTGQTPMEIAGPVRGSDLVKTKYSPDGTRTRGTLNNCAHGVTPWNTYMTAEENWAGYFRNGDQADQKPSLPREQARYGVPTGGSRYRWEAAEGGADEFVRFDASKKGAGPADDYRNEPNAFGWMVEIDPFNPSSTPVKRTALGRFAHEGVVFAPARAGRPVVCYSGDDARFEYIYKFVSARPYDAATANGSLLDDGVLYVAKFNDDGSGRWLPLVFGQGPLTPASGFASQADVLVNTRLAADTVGATKMDRPEWGAVDPRTGAVYFTLTNNSQRTQSQVDRVNPRARNEFGQIVRWAEAGGDHAALSFAWDLFIVAGDKTTSRDSNGKGLGDASIFGSPDGLWFDPQGRLWIQTDIGESEQLRGANAPFGNNAMLAADPQTGEIRRFLTGPVGQEITGVITTPDGRTMFVNVQHPGATTPAKDFAEGKNASRWPEGGSSYPRSATVIITKLDGGVIGT